MKAYALGAGEGGELIGKGIKEFVGDNKNIFLSGFGGYMDILSISKLMKLRSGGPKLNSGQRCKRGTLNSGSQKFEPKIKESQLLIYKCIVMIIRESWRKHQPEKDQYSKYGLMLATKEVARNTLNPLNLSRNTTNCLVYSTGWACYDEQCL